jgi:hypothetical protein
MAGNGFGFIRLCRAFPTRTRLLGSVPEKVRAYNVALRPIALSDIDCVGAFVGSW